MVSNCPRCATAMQPADLVACTVDVCVGGCEGVWFDRDELRRVDHTRKGAGPALQRILDAGRDAAVGERTEHRSSPLTCRRCELPLTMLPHELAREVDVHDCVGCGGVFVEAGDLARIRARRLTPDELAASRQRRRRRYLRKRRREQAGDSMMPGDGGAGDFVLGVLFSILW